MPTIELQCWLVLAASVVIMASAVLGLVAERYAETLPENIALVLVALAGFVVALQIGVRGMMQVRGIAFLLVAVAVYALVRAYKKWRELYRGPRS